MNNYFPPKVSIITVVFNAGKKLARTIESVLSQDYKNIEYIIVDGGSTDGSLEVIRKYRSRLSSWLSEPDEGIYDAMNKGLKMATGDLVGFLNSGDSFRNSAVKSAVSLAAPDFRNSIVCGAVRRFDLESDLEFVNTRSSDDLSRRLRRMPINHPATFVGMDVFRAIGPFDVEFQLSADYEFVMRAIAMGVGITYTEQVLTDMELGGISETPKTILRRAKENHLIRSRYGAGIFRNAMLSSEYLINQTGRAFLFGLFGGRLRRRYHQVRRRVTE